MKKFLTLTLILSPLSLVLADDTRDHFEGSRRPPLAIPVVATEEQEQAMALKAKLLTDIKTEAQKALELFQYNERILQIGNPTVNPGPSVISNAAQTGHVFIPEELLAKAQLVTRQLIGIAAAVGIISENLSNLEISNTNVPANATSEALKTNRSSLLAQLQTLNLSILKQDNLNSEALFNLMYGEPKSRADVYEGPSLFHVMTSPQARDLKTALVFLNDDNLAQKLFTSPTRSTLPNHPFEIEREP